MLFLTWFSKSLFSSFLFHRVLRIVSLRFLSNILIVFYYFLLSVKKYNLFNDKKCTRNFPFKKYLIDVSFLFSNFQWYIYFLSCTWNHTVIGKNIVRRYFHFLFLRFNSVFLMTDKFIHILFEFFVVNGGKTS